MTRPSPPGIFFTFSLSLSREVQEIPFHRWEYYDAKEERFFKLLVCLQALAVLLLILSKSSHENKKAFRNIFYGKMT